MIYKSHLHFNKIIFSLILLGSFSLFTMNLKAEEELISKNQISNSIDQFIYNDYSALEWWKLSFGIEPSLIEEKNLPQFIGYDENCSQSVKNLWGEMKNYGKQLNYENSELKEIKNQQERIQKIINNPPPNCKKTLQKHLAGASLALLTQGGQLFTEGQSGFYTYETTFLMVFLSLLHRDWIEIIDKQIVSTSEHKILGTYNCSNRKIQLDLSQSPLNIGGAIAHELQHMYSDKLSILNVRLPINKKESRKLEITSGLELFKISKKYFKSYLVLDESLAAFRAAYLQKRFKNSYYKILLKPNEIDDLTQFQEKGLMEQIYDAYPFNSPPALPYILSQTKSFKGEKYEIYKRFFLQDPFVDLVGDFFFQAEKNKNFNDKDWTLKRNDFFSQIHKIYFKSTPNSEFLDSLSPSKILLDWMTDPTDSMSNSVFGIKESMIDPQVKGSPLELHISNLTIPEFQSQYSDPKKGFFLGITNIQSGQNDSIFMNYDYLTTLLASIYNKQSKLESVTCKSISKELQNKKGELNKYLGVQIFNNLNSSIKNTFPKPGGEGAHPQEKSIRPCVEIEGL